MGFITPEQKNGVILGQSGTRGEGFHRRREVYHLPSSLQTIGYPSRHSLGDSNVLRLCAACESSWFFWILDVTRRGSQGPPLALNQLVMQPWVRWERVRSPVVWLAV